MHHAVCLHDKGLGRVTNIAERMQRQGALVSGGGLNSCVQTTTARSLGRVSIQESTVCLGQGWSISCD